MMPEVDVNLLPLLATKRFFPRWDNNNGNGMKKTGGYTSYASSGAASQINSVTAAVPTASAAAAVTTAPAAVAPLVAAAAPVAPAPVTAVKPVPPGPTPLVSAGSSAPPPTQPSPTQSTIPGIPANQGLYNEHLTHSTKPNLY